MDEPLLVEERIASFIEKKALFKQSIDADEIEGHLLKAEHNLRFVADVLAMDYPDWALTGCYYACYHAALALIRVKGYASKHHLATICVMIKEFYKKGLDKEDIETVSKFLDYEDILFYVESKNRREDATYSTRTLFDKRAIEHLRIKAVLFVNKARDLIAG